MTKAELQALRREYSLHELDESMVAPDPLDQFRTWMQEALASALPEPNAMTLATVNPSGQPTTRVVLLKELRLGGFVFYTNFESRKGQELDENPLAALNFLWLELERQVRIEGVAQRLHGDDSQAYFQARPRESQIGAWASSQSRPIPSRVILEKRFRELTEKYEGYDALPLPPFWGGYLLRPSLVEFWQGRASRLHDRIQYRRQDDQWIIERLQP
jgi:pyridoxamine 5'-phosphate oxidase